MRSMSLGLMMALSLAVLPGCSWFGDDEPDAPAAEVQGPVVGVPVQVVTDMEIGRTRDGYAINAYGVAPGLGYSKPRLRARRDGRPGADGYLDYDFVADPPDPRFEMPVGDPQARSLRAAAFLTQSRLTGVTGVRIHALERGVQMPF